MFSLKIWNFAQFGFLRMTILTADKEYVSDEITSFIFKAVKVGFETRNSGFCFRKVPT